MKTTKIYPKGTNDVVETGCAVCGVQCDRNECSFCPGQTQHRFYCLEHYVILQHRANGGVQKACRKCAAKKIKGGFWSEI